MHEGRKMFFNKEKAQNAQNGQKKGFFCSPAKEGILKKMSLRGAKRRGR